MNYNLFKEEKGPCIMRLVGKQTGLFILTGAISLLPVGKSVAQKASGTAEKSLLSSGVLQKSAQKFKGVATDVVESSTFDATKILDKYKWTREPKKDLKIPYKSNIQPNDTLNNEKLNRVKNLEKFNWICPEKTDVKIPFAPKSKSPISEVKFFLQA